MFAAKANPPPPKVTAAMGNKKKDSLPTNPPQPYCTLRKAMVHALSQGVIPGAKLGSVTFTPGAPFVEAGSHCTAPNPISVAVVASPVMGMERLRVPWLGHAVKMAFTAPLGLAVYHVAAAVSFWARQGRVL